MARSIALQFSLLLSPSVPKVAVADFEPPTNGLKAGGRVLK
jgi:hypothetical protein